MVALSGHLHAPLTHLSLPVHLTPQAPQLASSEFVFTQDPPQFVNPPHIAPHEPPMHAKAAVPPSGAPPSVGAPHRLPHIPQLSGSLFSSTQTPAQGVVPGGQLQVPPVQRWPAGHTRPHPPQLAVSVWVSVQPPAHAVWPVPHMARHSPLEQTMPVEQAIEHSPQCCGSLARSAHWGGLPQLTVPVGQVHPPSAQTMPPVHLTPQPPQ